MRSPQCTTLGSPAQTIFEVSMKAGSSAVQVMQQKRSYHGNVITRKQQKKVLEEEGNKASEEGVADGRSQEQSTDNDLKVSSNSTVSDLNYSFFFTYFSLAHMQTGLCS